MSFGYSNARWNKYVHGVLVAGLWLATLRLLGEASGFIWGLAIVGPVIAGLVVGLILEIRAPQAVELDGSRVLLKWRNKTEETDAAKITISRRIGDLLYFKESIHLSYGNTHVQLFGNLSGYKELLRELTQRGATSAVGRI